MTCHVWTLEHPSHEILFKQAIMGFLGKENKVRHYWRVGKPIMCALANIIIQVKNFQWLFDFN